MNNELQIFENTEFGRIRTIEKNGKILFVARDVAKMLGYSNTSKAINDHCKGVIKRYIPHPQGKVTLEVNMISEGDVYRLITHSKLPAAEKFENWVFDDVLPAIRRTGSYSAKPVDTHKEERLALMKRRVIVSEANVWEKLACTQDKAFNDYCRKNAALVLRGKKTKPYVANLDSEKKQPVQVQETAPQIAQQQTKFMYSVADIAEMFDVAVKTIAEAAIKNNMVTPKYGCWVDNVAPYSRRRVKAFRYFASSVETFKEILKAGGNHVAG